MLWGEFTAWLAVVERQKEGSRPQVDSWSVEDPWFQAKIDARGR